MEELNTEVCMKSQWASVGSTSYKYMIGYMLANAMNTQQMEANSILHVDACYTWVTGKQYIASLEKQSNLTHIIRITQSVGRSMQWEAETLGHLEWYLARKAFRACLITLQN